MRHNRRGSIPCPGQSYAECARVSRPPQEMTIIFGWERAALLSHAQNTLKEPFVERRAKNVHSQK